MFRRGIVQFRLRRAPHFGKLRVVPAADAGDEFAWRHGLRAARDGLLKLGNRKRALNAARFVTGIDPGARVVHVRIEEAWNDGSSAQIDRLRARRKRHRLTDLQNASILYGDRGPDNSAAIDELAV